MANNIEFEVEKVYKGRTTKSLLLLIPRHRYNIFKQLLSVLTGVAITPRLEPDGSIH